MAIHVTTPSTDVYTQATVAIYVAMATTDICTQATMSIQVTMATPGHLYSHLYTGNCRNACHHGNSWLPV